MNEDCVLQYVNAKTTNYYWEHVNCRKLVLKKSHCSNRHVTFCTFVDEGYTSKFIVFPIPKYYQCPSHLVALVNTADSLDCTILFQQKVKQFVLPGKYLATERDTVARPTHEENKKEEIMQAKIMELFQRKSHCTRLAF